MFVCFVTTHSTHFIYSYVALGYIIVKGLWNWSGNNVLLKFE